MLSKFGVLFCLACSLTGCVTSNQSRQRWRDADGKEVMPLRISNGKAVVLLFVRNDCPISNRYAPEMQRLYSRYRDVGIAFWLVYADSDTTPEDIKSHLRDFHLELPALRDPELRLVKLAGAKVTPEAAVFLKSGREIYRGRIDDRFADLGKERPEATAHDLEAAIQSVVSGQPVERRTLAVGCYINQ